MAVHSNGKDTPVIAPIPAFTALAAIADLAVAAGAAATTGTDVAEAAVATGEVDTRVGIKIGADVAQIGLLLHIDPEDPNSPFNLLYLVLDIITCLEQLNGLGNPDTGGKFTEGASKFYNHRHNDVYDILVRASLDRGRWSGPAAKRYGQANETLRASINTNYGSQIVAADNRMAQILARQADQVMTVGEGLAGTRLTVIGAIEVAITMWVVGRLTGSLQIRGVAEAILVAQSRYANGIAAAVGATALRLLSTLLDQAARNAHDVVLVIDQYNAVVRTADGILPRGT